MGGDFGAYRFTDEETRRILERAAEAEPRPSPGSIQDGHTLHELRAIAAEVGIDPTAIDRAAAEVAASGATEPGQRGARWSTLVHEDAVVPRPLTNREMLGLASQVEQIVGRRGLVSDAGPWVDWRDSRNRLYIGMVRSDKRTRLRAIADCSHDVVAGVMGGGVLGLMLGVSLGIEGALGFGVTLAAAVTAGGVFIRHRFTAQRRDLAELLEILKDAASP